MLVHKATMGVLAWYWTGRYVTTAAGEAAPQMAEYSFRSNPELRAEDWWEVPAGSRLGRALLAAYPYCEPVVDELGELIDITWHRAEERQEAAPQADKRGEKQRKQRRRSGLFTALLETEE